MAAGDGVLVAFRNATSPVVTAANGLSAVRRALAEQRKDVSTLLLPFGPGGGGPGGVVGGAGGIAGAEAARGFGRGFGGVGGGDGITGGVSAMSQRERSRRRHAWNPLEQGSTGTGP